MLEDVDVVEFAVTEIEISEEIGEAFWDDGAAWAVKELREAAYGQRLFGVELPRY